MKSALLCLSALGCLLIPSCSYVQEYRSQQLESESHLYDVKLERNYKLAVDGFWTWGKGNPYADRKKLNFYVAPMDVKVVEEKYPELAQPMIQQMHDVMKEDLTKAFAEANAANKTEWTFTDSAEQADLRFNFAVVSIKKRRPGLHIASKALSHFTPTGVSDALELIAAGDIAIEGTLRDAHSNTLLMAFKDSNRAPLRLYHKATYSQTGHVDANLRLWAEKLAQLCRESAHDRLGNDTIKHKVEERSLQDVIRTRVHDAL